MLQALIFLIQANPSALGQFYGYFCLYNATDISSRMYRDKINNVLSSLSTNIDSNGFYNGCVGKSPDRANAIVLCTGDVQLNRCHECVQDAAAELLKSCRIKGRRLKETIYGTPKLMGWNSVEALTSPDKFKEHLRALMDSLRSQAAYGGLQLLLIFKIFIPWFSAPGLVSEVLEN